MLDIGATIADEALAGEMQVSEGSPVFHSRVLHFENDEPVQLEERWVNPAVAPEYALQDFTNTTPNQYLVRVAPLQRVEYRIEALAAEQQRVVLTRDRELLKRRTITHGCYVRALRPREQLREVFERLDLAGSARPFRLCLMCNAPLRRIAKDEVGDRAPDGVLQRHELFVTCDVCQRVFWEGTHWQKMRALMDSVAATSNATE